MRHELDMAADMVGNDAGIPVVDLSSANAARELLDAAIQYGFIYIKHTANLALSVEDVDDIFSIVCTRYVAYSNRSNSII